MSESIIFYLTAMLTGIAVSIVIYVVRVKRKNKTMEANRSVKVDLERIEKYILPNNLGTPVDEVVKRMKTNQRIVPFGIDFTEDRETEEP